MKLKTIVDALRHYLLTADLDSAEKTEVLSSLISCTDLRERSNKTISNVWGDEVFVVTAGNFDNMLVELAYDSYDQLIKIHGTVQFEDFSRDCRASSSMEDLTDEQLQFGYEIISNLWVEIQAGLARQ